MISVEDQISPEMVIFRLYTAMAPATMSAHKATFYSSAEYGLNWPDAYFLFASTK